MPNHTVEKIGGTSMSRTHELLENVLIGDRKGDALYNRIFVVSAYGGITNDLLEHKKSGAPGVYALFASAESDWAWGDALDKLAKRMQEINAEIFSDQQALSTANAFVRERIEGVRSCLIDLHRLCSYGHFRLDNHLLTVREMLSALGEVHSAHNTALLLQLNGVNARMVDLSGWRNEEQYSLDENIKNAFKDIDVSKELPIVTGYAQSKEALMKTYDRGYSEVTLSRIAVITEAKEAIIHKEFHLSSADPKVVGEDAVQVIGDTNYDVADQLSNMGMEAIHPSAAKGLRQANIPLRIKNSFEPEHPGTTINATDQGEKAGVEIITGLDNVIAFEFFEQDMVGVKGYDTRILDALTRHKVQIISKTSNANTITHFLKGSLKNIKRVESDLSKEFPAAEISSRKVAFISAIGRNLKGCDVAAQAILALAKAGITPLSMQDLLRKVDVQIIVDRSDYDASIKILHEALVEKTEALEKKIAA